MKKLHIIVVGCVVVSVVTLLAFERESTALRPETEGDVSVVSRAPEPEKVLTPPVADDLSKERGAPSTAPNGSETPEEHAAREAAAEDLDQRQYDVDRRDTTNEEMARLERTWLVESADADWTAGAAQHLGELLSNDEFEGTEIRALECRESVCRIEMSPVGAADMDTLRINLVGPAFQGRKLASYDSGRDSAVMYVTREDESQIDLRRLPQ